MAKRRPITQEMPDAVREAVDRTVQATIGSAQLTRGRAQDAVDELVKTAESRAGAVSKRVIGAFEERRPVTNEDLAEIRTELRRITRRLAAIERRLDEGATGGSRQTRGSSTAGSRAGKGATKRTGSGRTGGKRTGAA